MRFYTRQHVYYSGHTGARRRELYEAYRWFVGVFRDASEKLSVGDRTAKFPVGSFPPALPFVSG